MSKDREIDWEAIEREYRAGALTVREIASNYGISHTAVGKRAKRDSWDRDLKARIQAKAESLVAKREVSKEVAEQRLVTDKERVEVAANAMADMLMGQKKGIQRLRGITQKLTEEMDSYEDELPRKIECVKKLAEAMKTLVGMEREAFGITSGQSGDDGISNPARGVTFNIVRAPNAAT